MKTAKASGKKPATGRTSAPTGQPTSRKPKLFMRLVTATKTDEPKARVYFINVNDFEGEQAAAVEMRNDRPFGLPKVINLAVGKWTLDWTPPSDPSGSLAALVRLAAQSWAQTKAFNAATPEEQNGFLDSLPRYSDEETKQLAARGLVPQCAFKPGDEQIKWTAACEWDRWNARGLQWGERMSEMEKMGCEGFKEMALTTFQSMCQRMGLKIVKG